MDMIKKNSLFLLMEKEIAEFLQKNDITPIFDSYSDCWVGRGIHFVQPHVYRI